MVAAPGASHICLVADDVRQLPGRSAMPAVSHDDEMKNSLPEVFMVEKGSVLHLRSTCSSLTRSNADLTRWCSKCSWKNQKHQPKNE